MPCSVDATREGVTASIMSLLFEIVLCLQEQSISRLSLLLLLFLCMIQLCHSVDCGSFKVVKGPRCPDSGNNTACQLHINQCMHQVSVIKPLRHLLMHGDGLR